MRRRCSASTIERSRRLPSRGRLHARSLLVRSWPILDEPLQSPFEALQPVADPRLERLDREERNQADHGLDPHRDALPAVRRRRTS